MAFKQSTVNNVNVAMSFEISIVKNEDDKDQRNGNRTDEQRSDNSEPSQKGTYFFTADFISPNFEIKQEIEENTQTEGGLSSEDTIEDPHYVSVNGIKLEYDYEAPKEDNVLEKDVQGLKGNISIKQETELDTRRTEREDTRRLPAEDPLQLQNLHHSSDIDNYVTLERKISIKLEEENEAVAVESILVKNGQRYIGPNSRELQQTESPERLEVHTFQKQNTVADETLTIGISDVRAKLSENRKKQVKRNNINKFRNCGQISDEANDIKYRATGKNPFKSTNSRKKVTTRSKTHSRLNTDEKPFICSCCKKELSNKFNLSIHLMIHTGEKPYKCDYCDKQIISKSSLIVHIRIHTGEKPFKCDLCDKQFRHKGHLTIHKRTHSGVKPFKCNICEKEFTNNANLTRHLKLHNDENYLPCNFCEQKFSTKRSLKTHLKTHTSETPFTCNYCEKILADKRSLSRHLKLHTGEKPFECEHCQKKFTEKHHLTRHLRQHTL